MQPVHMVLVVTIVLAVIMFQLNCQPSSLGEYKETCISGLDLITQGNSIPVQLDRVEFVKTIHVTDKNLINCVFLTDDDLVAVDEWGSVYHVTISAESVKEIAHLTSNNGFWDLKQDQPDETSWHLSIVPHTESKFLVVDAWKEGSPQEEGYSIWAMDINGTVLWSNPHLETPDKTYHGPIFYYSDGYRIISEDENNEFIICEVRKPGVLDVVSDPLGDSSSLFFHIPIPDGITWMSPRKGPYFSQIAGGEYERMASWSPGYDDGLVGPKYDPDGIWFGYKDTEYIYNEKSNFVVLKKGEPAKVYKFVDDLSLDSYKIDSVWAWNKVSSSSNGRIVFGWLHYLLKIENDEISIWHDDLDIYADGKIGVTTIGPDGKISETWDALVIKDVYLDTTGKKFIMLLDKSILYGGDELELLKLDSDIRSGLSFTPDYSRAFLLSSKGDIVILDVISTPSD